MKTLAATLLSLLISSNVTGSEEEWFLSIDCTGPVLSLEVSFDESTILKARGPACDAYENNIDGQWEKETLSISFEPKREVTWSGYRDSPFNSPAESTLTVDLWLAGADVDQAQWILGVTVRDDDTIYMNTLHLAALNAKSETCVAPSFCLRTSAD